MLWLAEAQVFFSMLMVWESQTIAEASEVHQAQVEKSQDVTDKPYSLVLRLPFVTQQVYFFGRILRN